LSKRERLSDAELLGAIKAAEQSALGGNSSAIQTDREDAVSRYYGKPYGNEQPGRSSVVSRDVADVLEGVVANVVKPIVSGDEVVRFDPIGPEDEAGCIQETDYVNHIALEKNNGFVWIVSAVKDAALQRVGYVKADWEVRSDVVSESYDGLSDEELGMLMQDKDVEVVEHSEYPAHDPVMGEMQPPPTLHDVKMRRKRPTEYVKLEPVPGDEMLVSDAARVPSLQDVDFCQHRPLKSISELRQAGYIIDDDIADDDSGESVEEQARQRFSSNSSDDNDDISNPARRKVRFKETYIRIDRDGDGVAELRRVCSVGETILHYKDRDGQTKLADEECDLVNIAAFSCVLVPHQHLGLSVYDLVEDIAKIKTALLRSYLDNRNLQNNGRFAINATNVNLDDFLTSRPGGVVRVDGDPAANIMPLVAPDTSTGALQGLEYLDTIREQRSGYTRNSAGIDNNALTNRTATGMSMQLSQSQLRLEMIARTIAETGMRDVFQIIHALTLKHSTREEKVRLKGKWVTVNPREWVRRSDMTITTGLGTGTAEQQLAKLMQMAPLMQAAEAKGMVAPEQGYAYIAEAFKLSGYKNPDKFVKLQMEPVIDPQTQQPVPGPDGKPQMKPKVPPPQPPPEVQVAQMKLQGEQQKLQATMQADVQKFQAEQQARQQEMALEMQVKEREQQNALTLQASNDERDNQKMQLEHQRALQEMAIKAQLEERKMLLDAELKREEIASKERATIQAAELGARSTAYAAEQSAGATKHTADASKPPPKPPVRGYRVKRGPDGRASELEVLNG
jgi:hypothetical protein